MITGQTGKCFPQNLTFQLIVMSKLLYLILILLSVASLAGQSRIVVDTLYRADSKYPTRFGMALSIRYYFLPQEEDRNFGAFELYESKYYGIERQNIHTGIPDEEFVLAEDVLVVTIDDSYRFIFPKAYYKIKRDSLWENGVEIEANKNQSLRRFKEIQPILINFYKDHKAVSAAEYNGLKVSPEELKSMYDSYEYDRFEIVVSNNYGDFVKMDFYFQW